MKQCSKCHESKPETEFWYNAQRQYRTAVCDSCRHARARRWREANKDHSNRKAREWRAANPERVRAGYQRHATKNPGYYAQKTREWRERPGNRVRQYAAQRERDRQLKDRVFMAYGGWVCACCGETEKGFLTVDHIENNGAQHRREIGEKRGGRKFYEWLVKNGFPCGFQILCMNCNWGKAHNKGVCPHQKLPEGSTTIAKASTPEATAGGSAGLRQTTDEDIVCTMPRGIAVLYDGRA